MEPVPSRSRARARVAVALAALVLAAAVVALAQPPLGDYTSVRPTNVDNAAPVLDALLRGDLARVPAVQPVMGPVSIAVRGPFAALGRALDGRQLEYWLGAVACLWALAALAIFLAARARRRDGGLAGPAVIVLVLVANPLTIAALNEGHPEELLAGALAVAAVLAAAADRPRLTGLLLGLALATKPWAALAVPPVLLALPSGRRRPALLLAGGVALALVAPLAAADPHRFLGGSRELAHSVRVFPTSAWWPVANDVAPNAWSMPLGLTRSMGQILAGALALASGAVALRRGRVLSLGGALSLLAGLMLARCALDSMNLFYYAVPFMVALVAWESCTRRGLPVVALTTSVLAWATASHPVSNAALGCALYLAWALPLAVFLLAGGRVPARSARGPRPLAAP